MKINRQNSKDPVPEQSDKQTEEQPVTVDSGSNGLEDGKSSQSRTSSLVNQQSRHINNYGSSKQQINKRRRKEDKRENLHYSIKNNRKMAEVQQ